MIIEQRTVKIFLLAMERLVLACLLARGSFALESDFTALSALYSGTGGALWFINTNWMDNTNPCSNGSEWSGVTVERALF